MSIKNTTTIAFLSGLIYLAVFSLPFPLPRYYATIPPVDYAKLTNYSPLGLIAYVVGLGALFWLYWQAIRLTAPLPFIDSKQQTTDIEQQTTDNASQKMPYASRITRHTLRFILLTSTFLAAISLLAYPLTAIDLFIYAIRSRGWALYGLNPLATAPEILPTSDPWLGLAAEWIDAPSPYGPLWEWLSLGAFYLSGGSFIAHLFSLKIVMSLAYLGCVWLVYKILQQLQPTWRMAGTVAFAWNPLVLVESSQNAHNDIVMTFFLLAAVWVFVQQWAARQQQASRLKSALRPGLICLFLALSILVKFVTIMTVPFFLLGIAGQQPNWPRRLAAISLYGLIIITLVILLMRPLWPGWDNWAVLQAGSQAGRSLLALLILGLRDWLGTNVAFDLSRNIILFIFALIYLYYLWQSFKTVISHQPIADSRQPIVDSRQQIADSNPRGSQQSPLPPRSPAPLLLHPAFTTLFWYVLLVAPVFHAWYLLWFAPLAVLLLPNRRPLIATITFSITALLIIPYFETIRVWYPFLLRNHFLGHLIGVPLLIAPPALVMVWPISRSRHSEV